MGNGMQGRTLACLAIALSVLLFAAWSAAVADEPGRTLELPDAPVSGRLLLEGKHCNECHGIAGYGENLAPDLGRGNFTGRFLDIGAAMWNHVPAMSVRFRAENMPWP